MNDLKLSFIILYTSLGRNIKNEKRIKETMPLYVSADLHIYTMQ